MSKSPQQIETTFIPTGAFAFFGIIITMIAFIWLAVYFLMIKQA